MNVLLVAPCFLIYGGLYLRTRILTLDQEITALDTTIATQETTLNTQIYRLYRLSPEEIATVEAG